VVAIVDETFCGHTDKHSSDFVSVQCHELGLSLYIHTAKQTSQSRGKGNWTQNEIQRFIAGATTQPDCIACIPPRKDERKGQSPIL